MSASPDNPRPRTTSSAKLRRSTSRSRQRTPTPRPRNTTEDPYVVDAEVFESVKIPHMSHAIMVGQTTVTETSPVPSRVKARELLDADTMVTLPRPPQVVDLPRTVRSSPSPTMTLYPSTDYLPSMSTPSLLPAASKNDTPPEMPLGHQTYPTTVSVLPPRRTWVRTLFFLGFFFPLLWIAGACVLLTERSATSPLLYRHNSSSLEKGSRPSSHDSTTLLAANALGLESRAAEDEAGKFETRWGWMCLWAFSLTGLTASVAVVVLYTLHVIHV